MFVNLDLRSFELKMHSELHSAIFIAESFLFEEI